MSQFWTKPFSPSSRWICVRVTWLCCAVFKQQKKAHHSTIFLRSPIFFNIFQTFSLVFHVWPQISRHGRETAGASFYSQTAMPLVVTYIISWKTSVDALGRGTRVQHRRVFLRHSENWHSNASCCLPSATLEAAHCVCAFRPHGLPFWPRAPPSCAPWPWLAHLLLRHEHCAQR